MKKVCVQFRRIGRQPVVRWGTMYVKKNFVRTAVLSFVPSTIDDVVIHHAQLCAEEIMHVGLDTVVINGLGILLTFVSKL
jgi:hypothetical protein